MKSLIRFALVPFFAAVSAEADDLTTGPPEGTEITPVQAYAPVGPWAGEEFDAAAEIGDGPGAFLFIHELTRNGLPVIRGLDDIGAEFALLGFKSFTFLLSSDRTAAETRLRAVNGSLKLKRPIVLSLDGADGPGNYALNRKAILSLIMLKGGKVQKSVALTDVNAEDAEKVRELIASVAGELPEDEEAWRELAAKQLPEDSEALRDLAIEQRLQLQRLLAENRRLKNRRMQEAMRGGRNATRGRMNTERGMREGARAAERGAERPTPDRTEGEAPARQREGKPPEDPQLNQLLRAFIRKDNDSERVKEVFADIESRAAESDALHAEAVEMFKLMLSFRDRYGNEEAQKLAESFLKAAASGEPESSEETP